MLEALPKTSHQDVIGFGPIERAREMSAENDAAFTAVRKTLVMGAGVFSASILFGNAVDYLMKKRQERKKQNLQ